VKAQAKGFIVVISLIGLATLGSGAMHPGSSDLLRFGAFLAVALVASRLKVRLPGMTGAMSVNMPFILIAACQLSLFESLIVACACSLVQSLMAAEKRPAPVQVWFNFCLLAISAGTAYTTFHAAFWGRMASNFPVLLTASACAYFLANTVPVAVILSLTEGGNVFKTWHAICQWTFPYYVASAGLGTIFVTAVVYVGWYVPMMLLPVMALIYGSYRAICGRVAAVMARRAPSQAYPAGAAQASATAGD